jgi:hypothetical protein
MAFFDPEVQTKGALHLAGAMPESISPKGRELWNWGGLKFKFGGGKPMIASGAFSLGEALMPAVGIGMTGMFALQGYQEGGVIGAARSFGIDAAVNTSMAQYGYTQLKNGNQIQMVPKPIFGGVAKPVPAVASKLEWFHPKNAWRGAMPMMRMGFRQGIGFSAGFATMNAIGGPLGFIAGATVSGLAVKHAGRFTAGGLAVGGAYLAGKAAVGVGSSILRAGRRHSQLQRQVQTAGDMSAFTTRGAYTMRERAVQAIQRSHTNSRSALGREASYLHSNRNYHSIYR